MLDSNQVRAVENLRRASLAFSRAAGALETATAHYSRQDPANARQSMDYARRLAERAAAAFEATDAECAAVLEGRSTPSPFDDGLPPAA